ncbi:MAG: GTPase ObgE [Clostridia bacterium]|nr:GTPase ObgE [Clostridia bacterium]
MFIDKIQIHVKAGNGGDGCVSFRREKYVSHGGPDGGDGGRGGNIVFRPDEGANTLLYYRYKRKFTAENGGNGAGAKFHGKNGEDVILPCPPGTVIRDAKTGKILHDLSGSESFIAAYGGKGGWGNRHFATPTRQVPNFAKNGIPGEEKDLLLELKMIADVGLVGLPSAGKSSLLAAVSAARPKIAAYHFTTLEPSLGVVRTGENTGFVMADIPGLIEGASEGAGLGHDFLRHIERCRLLLQVIDISGEEGRSPIEDFQTIDEELARFSGSLSERPRILALNKSDTLSPEDRLFLTEDLREEAAKRNYPVFFISASTHEGLDELLGEIAKTLPTLPPTLTYDSEEEPDEDAPAPGPDGIVIRRDPDGAYVAEGPWIDLLVNRVNFSDRESMMYFDRSLSKAGVYDKLREAGCTEGDSVRICDLEFDFYE